MGFINAWALTISGFLILAAVAEMLLPNEAIKKYAKLVLGLMLIILVIKPLLSVPSLGNMESDFTSQYNAASTTDQTELVRQTFAQRLEENMEDDLKAKFGNLNITVDIGVDTNNQFTINSITIGGANENAQGEISDVLIKDYGCDEIRFS